ncbi:MAG TPA: CHAT domain-containing protein [Kofleriaceae bacterium]|nr:CHAT domain-containing protein [Kofleriaceae bacterium]
MTSPRRWLRRAVLIGLSIGAVAGVWLYLHRTKRLNCEAASRTEPFGTVGLICQEEYERTRDPATGARLADAIRRSGNRAAASALANELLATEARSDAFWILGEIASSEKQWDRAADLLQEARKLHRDEKRHVAVARDALALGRIHKENNRLAEALYAVDECITEARTGADREVEGLCHLAAAHLLGLAGYFDGAKQEIKAAEPLLKLERDQARLQLELGNLEQEKLRGKDVYTGHEQAIAAFDKALGFATQARATSLVLSIEMNLSFSLAQKGSVDKAELHHKVAVALDRNKDYESELAQLAARIAYRRNDLERAFAMNAALYPTMARGDDRFEVCVIQARIALTRGDLAGAELWARRAIEEVEQIRTAQTALELRPWVLASRRAAHELLFVVLARTGRFGEAVAIFDRWQGHTLLEAMSRPELGRQPALAEMASKIQSLARLMPAASRAPLLSSEDRDVAGALRTLDLFALAIAEGDVWRVTARRGQLRIDRLGALATLSEQLDEFQAQPTNPALATAAGERLVPAELFSDTSTLHVILDTHPDMPLASLPVVALRRGDKPLIAVRPVLRLSRLPSGPADGSAGTTCEAPATTGGATVLADPDGSLPSARVESKEIAPLLATIPLVGASATSKALFAAKPSSVLHVAVHAGFDTYGGVLRLHDRPVSALEISTNKLGPPLVVLSGCSTARSADPELAGSLSTAFLASGSSQVIATLRPVTDQGAVDVMRRFYQRGGTADPVRALAAIQAELASSSNKDWPNFAVFGKDGCTPRGPEGTK